MQPMQQINDRKYCLDTTYPNRIQFANCQFFAPLECKDYAIFKDCNVQDVVGNSFLELEHSLAHKLTSTGHLTASVCNVVGNIRSGGIVKVDHCDTRSIDSPQDVIITASRVKGYIYSKRNIALHDVQVNEISAKHNLKLQSTTIFGRAEAGNTIDICDGVSSLGWLICSNDDLNLNKSQVITLLVRSNPSMMPQRITLRDSHVSTIIFEKPGGRVYLFGNSSVHKVSHGEIAVQA